MISLDQIEPTIVDLCQTFQVERLDLFGSITGNTFGPDSDVDVLVTFSPPADNLFHRYFALKESLEQLFGREIDLITSNSLSNPYFKASVEASRVNVYSAQHEEAPV